MRIAIASDHGGFQLKGQLVDRLIGIGHEVEDLGTHSAESCDYPDFAHAVANGVASATWDRGLLVCGTGVGMAMSANRHPGVRAVNCSDVYTAKLSRSHNDANVLCIGERVVGAELAQEILDVFLATELEGGRHARRVAKIDGGEG